MKIVIAILLFILAAIFFIGGIGGAMYVTFYQGWFKGIVGIIDFCRAENAPGTDLAFSIVRIVCASLGGAITCWAAWLLGLGSLGLANVSMNASSSRSNFNRGSRPGKAWR